MLNINEYLINKNTKAKDDELYLSLHVFRHESSFIRFFTKLKNMEVPEIIFTNKYELLRSRLAMIKTDSTRKLRYPNILRIYTFDDKLPIFSEPVEKYMKAENISKEELIQRMRAEH